MGHFTEALGPKKIKKLEQSNHVGEYKSIIPYQIESHEQINVTQPANDQQVNVAP